MNSNIVEWGVAGRQMPGEALSGDMHLACKLENGMLFAVADGLGHGEAAAQAANLALKVVEAHSHDPLVQIVQLCSQQLRETRGVAMSIAHLDGLENSLEWVGVGNVEGLLVHPVAHGKRVYESLLMSQGVVGVHLPPLRAAAIKVVPGDTLVLATDGIRRGFEDGLVLFDSPDETAQGILLRDGLDSDDALVLVAFYQGRSQ